VGHSPSSAYIPLTLNYIPRKSAEIVAPQVYPTYAMRTPKQIAAYRANGARSKGPVTAEVNSNSSRDSIRHGIFADTLVVEKQNPTQFLELLNELLDEHPPSTPTQTMLVEAIVAARSRRRRFWGIQKINFDCDIASGTPNPKNTAIRAALALRTNDESIRSHELFLRCEIAIDRQISRAILRLQQLQDTKASKDSNRNSRPNLEPVPSEAAPLDPPDATDPAPQSEKMIWGLGGLGTDAITRQIMIPDAQHARRRSSDMRAANGPGAQARSVADLIEPKSPASLAVPPLLWHGADAISRNARPALEEKCAGPVKTRFLLTSGNSPRLTIV